MFGHKLSLKDIILGINNVFTRHISTKSLKIDKVLVVSKLSRYEYEKRKYKDENVTKFLDDLKRRGADIEKLVYHYDLHKKYEERIVKTLKSRGLDVKVVDRYNYTEEDVNNCDVIIPIGGDGTFLLAASLVNNNQKPVIGFNSDPNRSEGYLCLPKKYSTNIHAAVDKLQAGSFTWLLRNRIRTTMLTSDECLNPTFLHDSELGLNTVKLSEGDKRLPFLALNEVFIGETLSARVSHLRMRLNGSTENTNLKCSGICVSTGTGSTSWHLSINRQPVQNVAELLRLVDIDPTEGKDSLATVLADIYNKNLIFPPDDKKMAYTIRELISAAVWPDPKGIKNRGFAYKLELRSNCYDAALVMDGGISFPFNDGATALLEIKPEDALRTVIFKD
ncbi:NAD kinase 2, mitochondrial isoform X2 [Sitophilus oryzae]|uniref:NAD(+) kinase n=1 Tax=Sitophilus oryzae TaxID=7048 RepID=A0A6J2Y946_SITOR|nr:NAD kinase 2, mitochondrial isoform X2 [Sitophilus oryzae]